MAKKNDEKKQPLRLEWVTAATLTPNPLNWRRHGREQLSAVKDLIDDVGWAGCLLYNERTKRLIDGHARLEVVGPDDVVPVLMGSWDEATEAKILATLDPVAGMATADAAAFQALIDSMTVDSLDLQELIDATLRGAEDGADGDDAGGADDADGTVPEMELRPFEHYDYVLVLARNVMDWEALCEAFGLQKVNASPIPGKKKIGLGRAIDAKKVLAMLGADKSKGADDNGDD